MLHQLVDAFPFRGGNGHHGNSELRSSALISIVPPLAHFVHHIERQHHGNIQVNELQRQIEVALYVCRVDDVDDSVGLVAQQKFARHHFLARVRRKRVDTRKIGYHCVFVLADSAVLAAHRDAGKVAHMLVRARQLVEQRGFAAVLVTGKCKGERRVVRIERDP